MTRVKIIIAKPSYHELGGNKNSSKLAPEETQILVSFNPVTKNLKAKGTLTIINNSISEPITKIEITKLPSEPVSLKL